LSEYLSSDRYLLIVDGNHSGGLLGKDHGVLVIPKVIPLATVFKHLHQVLILVAPGLSRLALLRVDYSFYEVAFLDDNVLDFSAQYICMTFVHPCQSFPLFFVFISLHSAHNPIVYMFSFTIGLEMSQLQEMEPAVLILKEIAHKLV